MRTSAEGRKFITSHEGTRLKPYKDVAGLWTIGVGHLINEQTESELLNPDGITEAESDALLASDLYDAERYVNLYIDIPLKQNEFDSLVSLVFNIGSGAFYGSTVRRLINSGDTPENIADAWKLWNKAGTPKRVIPGLVKRRESEVELYQEARYEKKKLPNTGTPGRVGSNNNAYPL